LAESKDFLSITLRQRKLLANALRIKILHVLADTPRTAKQVADLLGESPGNVHYHIKQLYDGGLLEQVETRESRGILEKYYKAKSTRLRLAGIPEHAGVYSRLMLSDSEAEQFIQELTDVVHRWEQSTARRSSDGAEEREIRIILHRVGNESDDSGGGGV
jgi:DNA-binding transcriptional ArsR family regulator